MKKLEARPRRESARKVTIMVKRVEAVTQLRLAHIQQTQSDIAELNRQITQLHKEVARLSRKLTVEWSRLRKEILHGAAVQSGPIRAFIRKAGGKKRLVVK